MNAKFIIFSLFITVGAPCWGAAWDAGTDCEANEKFWHAVTSNDYTQIEQLVKDRRIANIDARNENGMTALMVAAASGKEEAIRALVANNADVHQTDNTGRKARDFAESAHDTNHEIIRFLQKWESPSNTKANRELWDAASRNDIVKLEKALDDGAEIDAQHPENCNATALMLAAGRGHKQAVTQLRLFGANVNIQSSVGDTALMWAVINGDQLMFQLLLSFRPNKHLINNNGKTAADLCKAIRHGNIMLEMLKK